MHMVQKLAFDRTRMVGNVRIPFAQAALHVL